MNQICGQKVFNILFLKKKGGKKKYKTIIILMMNYLYHNYVQYMISFNNLMYFIFN